MILITLWSWFHNSVDIKVEQNQREVKTEEAPTPSTTKRANKHIRSHSDGSRPLAMNLNKEKPSFLEDGGHRYNVQE